MRLTAGDRTIELKVRITVDERSARVLEWPQKDYEKHLHRLTQSFGFACVVIDGAEFDILRVPVKEMGNWEVYAEEVRQARYRKQFGAEEQYFVPIRVFSRTAKVWPIETKRPRRVWYGDVLVEGELESM